MFPFVEHVNVVFQPNHHSYRGRNADVVISQLVERHPLTQPTHVSSCSADIVMPQLVERVTVILKASHHSYWVDAQAWLLWWSM